MGTSPPLLTLCLGNFMIGTGTLIVGGMLPAIAAEVGVTLPVAGQLITAFAFTVCISAPILAGLTSRFDRRALLVVTLLWFGLCHGVAALLSSFAALVAIRVLTSFGAALYTAQAAATAGLLAPPAQRGRAVAFVFLGWSIASVVGMPLGAYVGARFGFRAGFSLVAFGSAVAGGALFRALPSGLMVAPTRSRMWRELYASRVIPLVVAVTALQGAAQFALFSYFVPAGKAMLGASPALISVLLAAFGASGVLGNFAAGRYIDRFGAATVGVAAMLAMLAGHLLWPWSTGSLALFTLAEVVWASGCFAINSAQQARLLALSAPLAPVSIALNSSAIYLGQAAGTLIAAILLSKIGGRAGYLALPCISVPLFIAAICSSILAARRSAQPRP